MDLRDKALQSLTPVVMVPKFGQLEPLTQSGHRFLVADDGLWLEVKRAWMYARLPIATKQAPVPIPCGTLIPETSLSFGTIPKHLLDAFVAQAKVHLPNESAAVIIWNEDTGAMRMQPLEVLRAGPDHITAAPPTLAAKEHLVVDLHSHARIHAFFSEDDDKDDLTSVKIAGVVGNIDQQEQTYAFRVCVLGNFISL